MKENTESAPFLTEEDCNKYIHETFDGLHNDYTHLKEAAINGWQQAANKANKRICELEQRLAEVEKELEVLRNQKDELMDQLPTENEISSMAIATVNLEDSQTAKIIHKAAFETGAKWVISELLEQFKKQQRNER